MIEGRFILAIDPGLDGAYAFLRDDASVIETDFLPTHGEKTKRRLDSAGLAAAVSRHDVAYAVVERVGAMPGQGVSSMFRFGMAVGQIDGVLGALKLPIRWITPAAWKKHFNLAGKDKEGSRQRAIERWPFAQAQFARVKDHQRAEAGLLALYMLEAGR